MIFFDKIFDVKFTAGLEEKLDKIGAGDLDWTKTIADFYKEFDNYLKEFPNLLFCMNGHAHSYNVDDYYNDGVLYYQTPCAKKRGYLVFSITENGYEHELVEF